MSWPNPLSDHGTIRDRRRGMTKRVSRMMRYSFDRSRNIASASASRFLEEASVNFAEYAFSVFRDSAAPCRSSNTWHISF